MADLKLEIITQEKHLLKDTVDSVSAPAVQGEVTVLPHHISLFTKLEAGEVTYKKAGQTTRIIVSGGFMEISGGNTVTILADSAVRSDQVNLAKAEAAVQKAKEAMQEKRSEQDFLVAEASLRQALLELKVARRHRQTGQLPTAS